MLRKVTMDWEKDFYEEIEHGFSVEGVRTLIYDLLAKREQQMMIEMQEWAEDQSFDAIDYDLEHVNHLTIIERKEAVDGLIGFLRYKKRMRKERTNYDH